MENFLVIHATDFYLIVYIKSLRNVKIRDKHFGKGKDNSIPHFLYDFPLGARAPLFFSIIPRNS